MLLTQFFLHRRPLTIVQRRVDMTKSTFRQFSSHMLKLIGLRGVAIALTGSLLPLGLGWLLATVCLGLEWKAALAVGCTLAPTSMGIALNVLKQVTLTLT